VRRAVQSLNCGNSESPDVVIARPNVVVLGVDEVQNFEIVGLTKTESCRVAFFDQIHEDVA
jgi:hypothetical protein